MNDQTMILDINKYPAVIEPLFLRQGDKNGTTLRVTILDNGEPFYIGSYGVRLCLSIRDIYYEVEGVANENIAEFLIDESYLQYHGYSLNNYVSVYDGDTVICSTNSFKMVVYADSSSEAEPAEIFTNGVQEFLEESEQQVTQAVDRANQAAEAAEGIILQDVPLMTENIRGGAQLGGSTQTKSGKLEIKLTDSAAGETVTCPSASYLARLEKNGMSTQNGTPTPDNPIPIQVVSAPNLLDESTCTAKRYIRKTDGTVQTSNNWSATGYIPVLPGASYVLSGIVNSSSSVAGYAFYEGDKTYISGGASNVYTFTAPSNAAFVRISLNTEEPDGVMLNAGTVAQPYVPYGALGLHVHGENIMPKMVAGDYSGSGLTVTVDDNGVISISGTTTATYNKTIPLESVAYFDYTNYNVHFRNNVATSNMAFTPQPGLEAVATFNMYPSIIGYVMNITATYAARIPTLASIRIYLASGNTVTDFTAHLSIEESAAATDYEPYYSTVTPIDLDGNVLAALPDGTKDVLGVDSAGHVTIIKNTRIITFDGSESWIAYAAWDSTNQKCYYVSTVPYGRVDYTGSVVNLLCSHLQSATYMQFSDSKWDSSAAVTGGGSEISVRVPFSTVSEYKTWLSTANMFVLAKYVTPQTIDLGYIDIPELEDDCTIEVVSSLVSSMTATWWTNEAAPIPEAINAIKDLIGGDTQENTREVLQAPNLRESLRVLEDTDEQPEGIETEGE